MKKEHMSIKTSRQRLKLNYSLFGGDKEKIWTRCQQLEQKNCTTNEQHQHKIGLKIQAACTKYCKFLGDIICYVKFRNMTTDIEPVVLMTLIPHLSIVIFHLNKSSMTSL